MTINHNTPIIQLTNNSVMTHSQTSQISPACYDAAMQQRQSSHIYVTLAITSSALAFISTDIYLPFLQVMARVLHSSVLHIQASVAVFMAALALANLLITPLADHYGRKPILLCGLCCALTGTLLLLVPSITIFMLGRILQGLGAATGLGLSRAIIRDVTQNPQHFSKLYAGYTTVICLAPAASPLLGAYLQHHLGWRAVFIVLACLYCLQIFSVARFFSETLPTVKKQHTAVQQLKQSMQLVIHSPKFLLVSLMSATSFGLYIAYLTALPYILQLQLNQSIIVTAWAMASLVIGGLSSRLLNMLLVRRYNSQTMTRLGLALLLLATIGYALLQLFHLINIFSVIIPGILYVFASGFLYTAYTATTMNCFPNHVGGAAGIYSSIQVIGAVVFTAIVSVNHHHDMQLMAWLFAIGALLILVGHLLSRNAH